MLYITNKLPRFAPVAPPELLLDLKKRGALGSYHLLLAHDVAARPEIYQSIFDEKFRADPDHYIILDNSVIELGKPVDDNLILEAYNAIRPDVVVLPDMIKNMYDTINMSTQTAVRWFNKGMYGFMAVPQGKNFVELTTCFHKLVDLEGVKSIGIGRFVTGLLSTRRTLIDYVVDKLPYGTNIHLLGFSDNRLDDLRCAVSHPEIMGIDSTEPLRAGLLGYKWDFETNMQLPPRGEYWETAKEANDTVIQNIQSIEAWMAEQYI